MAGQENKTIPLYRDFHELENLYGLLINSFIDGLLIFENDRCLEANRAIDRILGLGRDEIIGRSADDLLNLGQSQTNRWDRSGNGDGSLIQPFFHTIVDKNGSPVPVTVRESYIDYQGRELCVMVIRDALGDDNAGEVLAANEKHFMQTIYSSSDAILLIEEDSFIDCNQAVIEMLRASGKEAVLMTRPSELSPEFQPDGQSSLEKAERMITMARRKGVHRFEWIHRRLDGELFPVEVTLTTIILNGRGLLHCVWRDLTDIKNVEKALTETNAQLKQRIKERKAIEQGPPQIGRGIETGQG